MTTIQQVLDKKGHEEMPLPLTGIIAMKKWVIVAVNNFHTRLSVQESLNSLRTSATLNAL